MAAPNIVNVSTIKGHTDSGALTTSSADLVTNAAASGKVYKLNSFIVSNVDGVNAADATIVFSDASASDRSIAKTVTVPAKASLIVIDKNSALYLEEGDKIKGLASANSDLEWVASYEEIS